MQRIVHIKQDVGARRIGIVLAVLVGLALLPNIAWLLFGAVQINLRSAIFIPAAFLLLLFSACGTRVWLACLVLVPFVVLMPAELFYVLTYAQPSNDEVLASVFATNMSEAVEYLGDRLLLLLVSALACLLYALYAVWVARGWRPAWRLRHRLWIIGAMGCIPLLVFSAGFVFRSSRHTRLQSGIAALGMLRDAVADSYPLGVPLRLAKYELEVREMAKDDERISSFHFAVSPHRQQPKRQIYVLVIGESSARDRWQLFGASRPTNPELGSTHNLVRLSDMLSPWTASVAAIPMLITRKPMNDRRIAWKEPSIVRAMRDAGFETWWISNQLPLGPYDSPVSLYAREAEHVVFVNSGGGDSDLRRSYDGDLLAPLHEAIRHAGRDLFIVLHMMGSHQAYDLRYPPDFAHFKPVQDDSSSPVPSGERIPNSYDNTVLYSDHVIAGVIRLLQESGSESALWFASDHGETLPTPQCPYAGHGLDTRSEFEVPALFWYSDAYEAAFPDIVATIKNHAARRTLTADTFETLMDIAGVSYAGRDESWSLASNAWHFHPRIVNRIRLAPIDFDKASFRDRCAIPIEPKEDRRPRQG